MKRDGGRSVGGGLHPVKLARVGRWLRALGQLGQAGGLAAQPVPLVAVAEGPRCLAAYAPTHPQKVVVWLHAPHAEISARLCEEARWFGLDAGCVLALAVPPGALAPRLCAVLATPGVALVVLDGRPPGPSIEEGQRLRQLGQVLQAHAAQGAPQVVLLKSN